MHLIARVGAWIATLFPLAVVPTVVTIIAAVFASLVACACFLFLEQRFASVPLRFVGWAICIALPIMGGEVVNNLANLHWYLLIAGFIAVMVKADRASVVSVQAIVLFVAVTSDALALLLLPFILFRLVLSRGWRDRIPDLAFLFGAVLQVSVVVAQSLSGEGRQITDARPTLSQFVDFYTYRVVFGGLFGVSTSQTILPHGGAVLPGLMLGAAFAVIVVAAVVDRERRVFTLALATGSIAFSAVVFSLQWYVLQATVLLDFLAGARYTTVPTALLLLSLLQAADVLLLRLRRVSLRIVSTTIVVAVVVAPMAIDFRPQNIRADAAGAWSRQIDAADAACAGADPSQPVTLPVSPSWFSGVDVTCAMVIR